MLRQSIVWKYAERRAKMANKTWICTWRNLNKKPPMCSILRRSFKQKVKWNAQKNLAKVLNFTTKQEAEKIIIGVIMEMLIRDNINPDTLVFKHRYQNKNN